MTDLTLTGREPCLSPTHTQPGKFRLPLKRLAGLLEVLPPERISLEVLAEALNHEAFYVRHAAAKLLNRRGDRAARLIMQKVLNEGNVPSRASVARHLYGFSWFAIEPLVHQALGDPDVRVRESVMYALCDARDLSAYQLMRQALQQEVDSVRSAAAWGLRQCQDPVAIPVFEEILLASDPEVRVRALEILGTNGLTQTLPLIRDRLHDPDSDVQYAAVLSLLEIVGELGLGELANVILNSHGATRQAVLRGVFHATNYLKINLDTHPERERLVDAFAAALTDDQPETREAAIWPLAWMHHPRVTPILVEAYQREIDPDVRAAFIKITGSLEAEAAQTIA